MFDISFSELLLIGAVALVVIGPERLPKVARTAGLLLGRAQRYIHDVKTEIEREAQLEEIQRIKDQARESAMRLENTLQTRAFDIESQVKEVAREATEMRPLNRPAPPPADVLAAEPPALPPADILAAEPPPIASGKTSVAEAAPPDDSVSPPPPAQDDKQLCIDFGDAPQKS